MAYDPITDFPALSRQGSNGVTFERMPGLDFVISALARSGLCVTSVGQTAPTSNQSTTVWIKPAQPSWSAEAKVYLWDADNSAYALATPALWAALFALLGLGTTLTTWRDRTFYGAAAPVSGAYERGDIVWNTTPTAGGNVGWVCVTAGSPGTWKTFGAIAA